MPHFLDDDSDDDNGTFCDDSDAALAAALMEAEIEDQAELERRMELRRAAASSFSAGARVRRGPDWKWGDQDGGAGNAGTITEVDSDGWVRVKWDKGSSNKYRTEKAGGTDLIEASVGEYVVSGAGGICASTINGTYSYTRQHNGAPLYTKEGGRAILYYGGGQYGWRMSDTDNTGGWYYSKKGSSGSVPCGQWTKDGYSGSDVLPCPTVARVGDDSAGGRPQVGATVLVLSASDSSTRSYVGQTGRLLEDDKSGRPFKVEFDDGNTWWFKEGELQKVGSLLQSAHRQTPWSGSVKCHGCGMYGPSPQTGPGGCAHCGLCGVCCAKPGRAQCTKAPSTLSPELTGVSTLCVGARVRVKRSVSNPTYGWGGVTHGKVGIVKRVDPDGDLKVDFPDHSDWNGKSSEMEVVTATMVTDRVAAERRAERRAERLEKEEFELALAISASLAEQEQLEQRDRLAAAARAAIQPPVVPSVGPPTNMPSAPPAHSSAPPDETVCIICMDEPRNATLVHGDTGHVCCCLKCAQDLKAKGLACPMCRKPIDVVIRQFT